MELLLFTLMSIMKQVLVKKKKYAKGSWRQEKNRLFFQRNQVI